MRLRLLLLCLVNGLVALAQALYFHIPEYVASLGGGSLYVGMLLAGYGLGEIAIRPMAGIYTDNAGRRPVLLMGFVLFIAATLLFRTVTSTWEALVLIRMAQGASIGLITSALLTILVDELSKENRVKGISYFTATGMIGTGLAAPFGSYLINAFGFLFVVDLTIALVGLSLLATVQIKLRPPPSKNEKVSLGDFFRLLLEPSLIPIWIAATTLMIALYAVFGFVKELEIRESLPAMTYIFGPHMCAALLVRFLPIELHKFIGSKGVVALALIALSAGLGILSQADNTALLVVSGLLIGTAHGYGTPIVSAIASNRISESQRGTGLAVLVAVMSVGPLVAGLGFGVLAEAIGVRNMFASAAAVPILGLAMYFIGEYRLSNMS